MCGDAYRLHHDPGMFAALQYRAAFSTCMLFSVFSVQLEDRSMLGNIRKQEGGRNCVRDLPVPREFVERQRESESETE